MNSRALELAKKIERLQREFSMLPKLEERHDLREIEEYQHYILELEEALILFRYFVENPTLGTAIHKSVDREVMDRVVQHQVAEEMSEEIFSDMARDQKTSTPPVLVDDPEEPALESSSEETVIESESVEEPEEVIIEVSTTEVEAHIEIEEEPEPEIELEAEEVSEEPVQEAVSETAEEAPEELTAESREEIIDEILAAEPEISTQPSINESQPEETTLADRLARSPIKDLRQAFGLNERFYYANELFNGDGEEFVRALNEFNHLESYSDAQRLIDAKYRALYKWDDEDEVTQGFLEIIERRYL
ncbi:hypothetical protein KFE98_09025 [bacterium SCSIO 12741]|nr:hypothetical protein KFE98_09025 [bacterium SCSIO 12741]